MVHRVSIVSYSGDLNSKQVRYLDHGDLFAHLLVCYSDAQYHDSFLFRSVVSTVVVSGRLLASFRMVDHVPAISSFFETNGSFSKL